MSKRNSLGLNLAASWVCHMATLLVGVFLMPYVLHVLGDSQYGSWIFINSLASYSGLLYLGFGQTLSRFVASHSARGDWNKLNQCVSVVFTAYSAMGLFALSVAGVLAWWAPTLNSWEPETLAEVRPVILLLGLNVACGMVGSTFGGVLIGLQRFDIERMIHIAADVTRMVIILLCLRPQWGLVTLASAFLATTVMESVLYCCFAHRCIRTLAVRPRYLSRAAFRESFGFSLKAFVGIVAGQVIAATDLIIIGQFLGKSAIVPYYIALRLCQFLQRPIQQIGDVSLPRAGQLASADEHEAIQKLVSHSVGLSFLLISGMYVGAAYFGDGLIATWMGPEYVGSHRLLLILMGAQLVTLPCGVLRQILFGAGHVRTPALLLLGAALANLACTITLIRYWGLAGVAIGTTLPLVLVELTLLIPFAFRKLGLEWRRTLQDAIRPAVAPLVVLWLFCFSVDQVLPIDAWPHWLGIDSPSTAATAVRWTYMLAVAGLGGGAYLVMRFAPQIRERLKLSPSPGADIDRRQPAHTSAL